MIKKSQYEVKVKTKQDKIKDLELKLSVPAKKSSSVISFVFIVIFAAVATFGFIVGIKKFNDDGVLFTIACGVALIFILIALVSSIKSMLNRTNLKAELDREKQELNSLNAEYKLFLENNNIS